MSDAKVSNQDLFSFGVCSQCFHQIYRSATRDSRHAVPCGHVFCTDCLGKVETEQKSGKSFCRRQGCARELGPISTFGVSWCTQRAERLIAKHDDVFGDQGNVGDRSRAESMAVCSECGPDKATGKPHLATHRCETCGDGTYYCDEIAAVHPKMKASRDHVVVPLAAASPPDAKAEPAWNLCAEHKLPFQVVEASSQRPMCAECLSAARGKVTVESLTDVISALQSANSATSAELDKQKTKLAELTLTTEELCVGVAKWGAEETARIKAWEEREVKHIQGVAAESVALVQEVCARRIEVGSSLITQHMGLRASLEELDQALANLPADPATRLGKMRAVYTERKQLCDLLASNKIIIPSSRAIRKWAELPTLAAEFDQKAADKGGLLANAVSTACKNTLSRVRTRTAGMHVSAPKDWRELPVIPKLDAAKPLRSISMSAKPNVFVGLDDDNIVVGFHGSAQLQVLDLGTGTVVRELDGKGQYCYSMIGLPNARIAVGWYNGATYGVTIFDVNTGERLQDLTGWSTYTYGLALVEDHLLACTNDKALRVWSQDTAGKFTEKAKFATTGNPYGMLTVLSPSTVALSMNGPVHIEVWDWKAGKCLTTLTGFAGSYVLGSARLSDGRFIGVDWGGFIRVGSLDNWAAATPITNGNSVISVVAGQDGSYVTTDNAGRIKLWRNGTCDVTLTGACPSSYYGVGLAVVGRRLVVVGSNNNLLVTEP